MRKEDLLVDYVLLMKDVSTGKEFLAKIIINVENQLAMSSKDMWFSIKEFNDNLEYGRYHVLRVYGRGTNMYGWKIDTDGRKLLWERTEPKDMTLKEIEAALGHRVRIV